jgi:hypothetical protein
MRRQHWVIRRCCWSARRERKRRAKAQAAAGARPQVDLAQGEPRHVSVAIREGGEHGERRWGRWQSARTGAGEEFAGTFSMAVDMREEPMAKGQKRSSKEAKKPKANKPKTSVSDYKKSVIASGHK